MKFELNRLPRAVSDEDVIHEILRVSNIITDDTLTTVEFNKHSKISSSSVLKRFGSWKKALDRCGLGSRYSGRTVSNKMKSQVAKKMLDSELIEELKSVAKKSNKKQLSQPEFNAISDISASAITRRFGTWGKALKLAGLEEVKMGKRYSEREYFENLLDVWTHYGRQPYYREMDLEPSKISSGGYERRWGKWSTALSAFVDYMNDDSPVEEIIVQKQIVIKKSISQNTEEKRDIPMGLRYKVLSRDRFRCVKCGISPSSDLNCQLHVDHVIPYSKGGKTNLENLQSTCSACNLGKGNRYQE
jgi:hypothetical protein